MTTVRTRPEIWIPILFGVLSAAIAVAPNAQVRLALALPPAAAAVIWWSLQSAHRWLALFFLCALLTPPLPLPGGDSGVHLAPLLVLPGLLAAAIRIPDWRCPPSSVPVALGAFLTILMLSASLAALYSGADAGIGSMARVALFGIGVFVFFYACAGPRDTHESPPRFVAFLFFTGAAAALFGCADFYFHFPAPGGFEEQFVWLDEGVFRRAQGLFYEASTFGNLCAFFLVMIAVSFSRGRSGRGGNIPLPRLVLAAGGIVFGAALILSYSRASLLNLLVACMALAFLRRVRMWRALALALAAAVAAILGVRALWPSFSASYWARIVSSLQYFWSSPDGVLSGRVSHWNLLMDFLIREPWHGLFGIGYKTLPYTDFVGARVIADNTYLGLLVETGVVGLALFLALNRAILRAGLRAARSSNPRAVFFGEWIFCFWAGEMIQMFSGDLITYWRVLPVYFWVLGTAVREADGNL